MQGFNPSCQSEEEIISVRCIMINIYKVCTYSTCFDHSGGSLKVMNIQLVRIVHIMIMLKRVRRQLREKHGNGDDIYSITVYSY